MKIKHTLNRLMIPSFVNSKVNDRELIHELKQIESKIPANEFWNSQYQKKIGSRCFLLATGPSLNEIDLKLLKDEDTFGVNSIYKIAQKLNLDYYVYVSDWYWKQHLEGINSLQCKNKFIPRELFEYIDEHERNIFLNVHRPANYNKIGGIRNVPSFFSRQPGINIAAGGTVLFLCLQIIFFMGYDEVILLGVDHSYGDQNQKKFMRPGGGFYESRRNDQLHFDKNYVADYTKVPINLFAMERAYEMAHAMFKGANRQIINASAGSKLDIFPRADFMSIL